MNASTANGDVVTLNGIEIDGAGAGYNGIVFNSGGKFTVSNCVVENFFYNSANATGNGILIQPGTSDTFNFEINNTVVANNQNLGISCAPFGNACPTQTVSSTTLALTATAMGRAPARELSSIPNLPEARQTSR